MSRVVGREAVLAEVATLLRAGESVALHGPAGVGKSALLDAIESSVQRQDGVSLLRAAGAADEHGLPYAALRDVISQVPTSVRDVLPDRQRRLVDEGLVGLPVTDEVRADLGVVLRLLVEAWSAVAPVLLLLDDAQLLDADSSVVLGYARRRLVGRFALVATLGPSLHDAGIDVSGLHHLEVQPLPATDMVELLCEHGLAADVALRVHVESGGMPATALAMAGALGRRPSVLGSPPPMPSSITRVLRDRVHGQPEPVRTTLVTAALVHRPTVRQLERAGRIAAEEHLRRAALAGLVTDVDGAVRFTPSALRTVVIETTPAAERVRLHRGLADSAASTPERLRHLALADPRPDPGLAADLHRAAEEAAGAGAGDLAAELWLLAADRAAVEQEPQRAEWLARAVETAAPGNHHDLVSRALHDFWEAAPSADQAVRVRLAIPELAGGGVAMLDEVLTAALADAADDDRLVARVLLQRARIALRDSRPAASEAAAERAVRLLEPLDDPDELALGLTTLAVARRWLGGDHRSCLERAVALGDPGAAHPVHISPVYMAARFAFYDDRLDEAWAMFLDLLSRVERGAATDQLHVLRCLVEVGCRRGRCREALDYAVRAERLAEEFELDAQTSWFITGLAELTGGDLAQARTLASRGAAAAEEVGDTRYLLRHLGLLGQVLLRSGEAGAARETLLRLRALERERGLSDPTANRWHADLVSAEVLLGRLDDADSTLAEARAELARRTGADDAARGGAGIGAGGIGGAGGVGGGVTASLDRAEAELLLARGDVAGAEALLVRADEAFARLLMPVEQGRALLVRAHLERRRRRVAAGRTQLQRALDLFTSVRAEPWVAQVRAELEPERVTIPVDQRFGRLNDTESRIAGLVADGASNREIAERTYLSVKTVEATLTRIYRKLDVRSRTQLAALLRP